MILRIITDGKSSRDPGRNDEQHLRVAEVDNGDRGNVCWETNHPGC